MKTSQLIDLLQKSFSEHGDLDLRMFAAEDLVDVAGIAHGMNDRDVANSLTICDVETLEAFAT